jgi:hypothetical protein
MDELRGIRHARENGHPGEDTVENWIPASASLRGNDVFSHGPSKCVVERQYVWPGFLFSGSALRLQIPPRTRRASSNRQIDDFHPIGSAPGQGDDLLFSLE